MQESVVHMPASGAAPHAEIAGLPHVSAQSILLCLRAAPGPSHSPQTKGKNIRCFRGGAVSTADGCVVTAHAHARKPGDPLSAAVGLGGERRGCAEARWSASRRNGCRRRRAPSRGCWTWRVPRRCCRWLPARRGRRRERQRHVRVPVTGAAAAMPFRARPQLLRGPRAPAGAGPTLALPPGFARLSQQLTPFRWQCFPVLTGHQVNARRRATPRTSAVLRTGRTPAVTAGLPTLLTPTPGIGEDVAQAGTPG